MAGLFSETIFGIPWAVVAGVALLVAVAFVVVDIGAGIDGWRWFVLRWFHSLCWLLLATAALARTKAVPIPTDWAGPLAAAGGVIYVIFAVTLFVGRTGV